MDPEQVKNVLAEHLADALATNRNVDRTWKDAVVIVGMVLGPNGTLKDGYDFYRTVSGRRSDA